MHLLMIYGRMRVGASIRTLHDFLLVFSAISQDSGPLWGIGNGRPDVTVALLSLGPVPVGGYLMIELLQSALHRMCSVWHDDFSNMVTCPECSSEGSCILLYPCNTPTFFDALVIGKLPVAILFLAYAALHGEGGSRWLASVWLFLPTQ